MRAQTTMRTTPVAVSITFACVLAAQYVTALDNGLAKLPPMGFANWNGFGCNYNDSTIRSIADALVSTGMRDVGYKTVIIQECIAKTRDASGVLQPDPAKFPHGIPDLVNYIHSKGLKAGIYTDVGPKTCAGYQGSYEHEQIDAQTFASWGIDFVEEDSCYHPTFSNGSSIPYRDLYARMRDALNATGRPIVFYSCVQGQENVQQWGPYTANLWRTTGDICAPGHATWSGVMRNFYGNAKYPNVSGPGQWQDPDMLVVGMPGLSAIEWRTHFSLWAISAAPLWSGIDLTNMPEQAKAIFLNKEVVDIDQDPLGIQGTRVVPGPYVPSSAYLAQDTPVDGTQLTASPCAKSPMPSQRWSFNASSGELTADGICATIESCGTAPGVRAITWECVGSKGGCPANQQFHLIPIASQANRYQVVNNLSSLCLSSPNRPFSGVVQETCTSNTVWALEDNRLTSGANSSLCLTAGTTQPKQGEVWAKPLASSTNAAMRVAAVFFNPDDQVTQTITLDLAKAGFDPSKDVLARDLWSHQDVGPFLKTFNSTLGPHDSRTILFSQ